MEDRGVLTTVDKFLNEISQDHPAARVQVDAVGVELPAVPGGQGVGRPVHDPKAQGVAAHVEEANPLEAAAGRSEYVIA